MLDLDYNFLSPFNNPLFILIIEILFILLTNNIIRYPIKNYIASLSLNPILYSILVVLINVVITIFIYKLFNNFFYKYCFVVCFILFIVYPPMVLDNFYIVYVNGITEHFLYMRLHSFANEAARAQRQVEGLREMIHSLNTAASVCDRRGLIGLENSFINTRGRLLESYKLYQEEYRFFSNQRELVGGFL